ncbi:MAG: S-adenosylmethionine:tRNA ribosyltransferase-isomerase [Bdellovibrio sp.]|nr:S-adenosylmethionine:tRNA ribosyltransferase-isomerase [Bdellovibrio sp.]
MKRSDLVYDYPESLIATSPSRPTRVMWVEQGAEPVELTLSEVIEKIPAGDVFVINNTKVLKRRVFSENETEILFLDQVSETETSNTWSVLFPSKKIAIGQSLKLPNGFEMKLIEKGRPQKVEVFPKITQKDFDLIAEMPLPPYIQKARGDRHNTSEDSKWYQTAWAENAGSFAAPTASLHFTADDILTMKNKGVQVVELTLHVGLGTFLPVLTEDLNDHTMHEEIYAISEKNWKTILEAKENRKGIWSLGTTSTRVLESVARTGVLTGSTGILLQEGSEFKIVNRLLTNFHQPESTLLALVSGFVGLNRVKHCYSWAVEKKFKLFSYGDLSVWFGSSH